MQKTTTTLPEIKLIGLICRTNKVSEMNQDTAKIGQKVQEYFTSTAASKIPKRNRPGITYCAYTNYSSDHDGDYDFFIGEEVASFDNIPEGFAKVTIPAQTYSKFTSESGAMPAVCVNAWLKIWTMKEAELGGIRTYRTDFELYDERASDPANTILDIFIGVK